VEAEPAGFLKLLEPLQRRIVQRQLRTDLQTLKDVVENFLQWPIDLDAFFDAHSSGSCAPNTLSGAMMPQIRPSAPLRLSIIRFLGISLAGSCIAPDLCGRVSYVESPRLVLRPT
jgi:hypothetical protein